MSNSATITPDLGIIQDKLVDFLTTSGWRDKLKTFLVSSDFTKILAQLSELKENNIRFTPPLKDLLRCFINCPYNDLKVIIIGSEPFRGFTKEGHPIADGMAFSLRESNETITRHENSLIRQSAGDKTSNTDLSRWAKQGVLLLNTSLTSPIGTGKPLYGLYKPFISFVLDMLNSINQGLIFVFVGKEAEDFEDLINEQRHFKFSTEITNAVENREIFKEIDKILMSHFQTTINW
jgi:uracil-DNA glycosylase